MYGPSESTVPLVGQSIHTMACPRPHPCAHGDPKAYPFCGRQPLATDITLPCLPLPKPQIDITKEIPLRPPTYRPREVPTPVQDELEGMAGECVGEAETVVGDGVQGRVKTPPRSV